MSNWYPIEIAPKDGTSVLGVDKSCKTPIVCMIHWGSVEGVGKTWRLYDELLWDDIDTAQHGMIGWMESPTHWMQLPEHPVE